MNNTDPTGMFGSGIGVADMMRDGLTREQALAVRKQLSTPPTMEGIHAGLDAGGMFPALGAIPDAANTILYTLQGDWENAALSGAAIVPVLGQTVTAGKWSLRASDTVGILSDFAKQKGNFTLGSASADDARKIGENFVGTNAVEITNKAGDVIGLRNAGNTRVYRFPSVKKNGKYAGQTRANLVEQVQNEATGQFHVVRNGHIDIVDQ